MVELVALGKSILFSKIAWIVIAIVVWSGACMMYGKSCQKDRDREVVYETIIKYDKAKDRVHRKYDGNVFTDICVLSGCIPDAATGDQCKPCKQSKSQ